MAVEYTDTSYSLESHHLSIIDQRVGTNSVWHEGYVITPHGIVGVSAGIVGDVARWSRLEYVHDGYLHRREYVKFYQPRYLVTLAKRFAAEVADRQLQEQHNAH